jgi:hypothetical protein
MQTEKATLRVLLRRNRLLLIVGLMLLVYGLWINFQWLSAQPSAGLYLVNLSPGASILLTWYLVSQNAQKYWGAIAFGILITVIIAFFAFESNIAARRMLVATTPDTEQAEYREVRDRLGDSDLVRHFPPTIPNNATNSEFVYFGGFMQGGAFIQLRLQLPPGEVAKLLQEYHSKAKYQFIGGDTSAHANEPKGVPTTYFYTSGTDDRSFPNNYETLVLDAQPGGAPDSEWNHGYSYGVVISLEHSEIIYWAEDW